MLLSFTYSCCLVASLLLPVVHCAKLTRDQRTQITLKRSANSSSVNSSCGVLCTGPGQTGACSEEFCVPGNSHFFQMRRDCGAVCRTDVPSEDDAEVKVSQGRYFDAIRKQVDCQKIWGSPHMDVEHEGAHPAKRSDIPGPLADAFTYGGRVPETDFFFDAKYYGANKDIDRSKAKNAGESTHLWKRELIDDWVEQAKEHILKGNYGLSEAECLAEGASSDTLQGKNVLVIGSENPWVEAICLAHGAAHVTTLEYAAIESTHPQVHALTPAAMRHLVMNNKLEGFDAIVTFSSVEHSGLGRYGDALNPWGDLITMSRAWCVSKPGASLILGTMTSADLGGTSGGRHDLIRWNADRDYGKIMYPHLVANWEQKEEFCGAQKVFRFERMPALAGSVELSLPSTQRV